MNDWKIPLYKTYSDDEDIKLITKILKRGTYWAIGPEIEEFEKAIANYVGVDYCLALNSGTSALHALFLAYNIKNGDEVIVPSFSFISTANSVLFVNAKPIFVDIEERSFGLDPELIPEKISSLTKAIVPMDYGGLSCRISEIKKICMDHKLPLIEDAAESLGASVHGKKVGTYSDSAICSFCGNKVLTTGEGGAIVTNSKDIYEKIKLIRSHGRLDDQNYFEKSGQSEYVGVGYNWRMSSITAALGVSQIQKLDSLIEMRQKNANYLSRRLSSVSEIKTPEPPAGYSHVYQMYTIRLHNKETRNGLQKHLSKKKIFSKVYFFPIHLTKFYKEQFGTKKGFLPVTEKLSEQVLTLPMYPSLTNEELDYLVDSIREYFEN